MSVDLDWNGDEVLAALLAAAEEGLGDAAEGLLEASQDIVPTDDGELHGSGRATRDGLEAAVSYNTPYAVLRHESDYADLQNGQLKFLEKPMVERGGEWLEKIATPIQRVIS